MCAMFSVLSVFNDVICCCCCQGMHHQGVFRVSGSQHEINEFRNQFEQGTFMCDINVHYWNDNAFCALFIHYSKSVYLVTRQCLPIVPGRFLAC